MFEFAVSNEGIEYQRFQAYFSNLNDAVKAVSQKVKYPGKDFNNKLMCKPSIKLVKNPVRLVA
jgi:hypothetical protein